MRRQLTLLLAASALAACISPVNHPPVTSGPPMARVVQGSREAVRERLTGELRGLGFVVMRSSDSPGSLRGELLHPDDGGWASCERVWTRDPASDTTRQSLEAAEGVRTVVVLYLSPLEGQSTVSIDARHLGQYTNPYTNTPFEEMCGTTGTLERRLLDAAAS